MVFILSLHEFFVRLEFDGDDCLKLKKKNLFSFFLIGLISSVGNFFKYINLNGNFDVTLTSISHKKELRISV